MAARILYRDSQGRDGSVHLDPQQPCFIGRALDCAVRTDDAMVSRKHSMIRMEDGRFCVEDLGSSNGTHVNEVRVQKQALSHNDVVRCGSLWLRFVDERSRRPGGSKPKTAVARPQGDRREVGLGSGSGANAERPAPRRAQLTEERDLAELVDQISQNRAPQPAGAGRSPGMQFSVVSPGAGASAADDPAVTNPSLPPPEVQALQAAASAQQIGDKTPPPGSQTLAGRASTGRRRGPRAATVPAPVGASAEGALDPGTGQRTVEESDPEALLAQADSVRRDLIGHIERLREENARLKAEVEGYEHERVEATMDEASEATAQIDPERNPAAIQHRALVLHDELAAILVGLLEGAVLVRTEVARLGGSEANIETLVREAERALASVGKLKRLAGIPVDD